MEAEPPAPPLSDAEVDEGLRALRTRPTGAVYWGLHSLFVLGYVWLGLTEWAGALGWVWIVVAAGLAVIPFVAPSVAAWRHRRMSAEARRQLYRKRLKQAVDWDLPPLLFLALGVLVAVMQYAAEAGPAPFALIVSGGSFLTALQLQRARRRMELNREHLVRLESAPPAA